MVWVRNVSMLRSSMKLRSTRALWTIVNCRVHSSSPSFSTASCTWEIYKDNKPLSCGTLYMQWPSDILHPQNLQGQMLDNHPKNSKASQSSTVEYSKYREAREPIICHYLAIPFLSRVDFTAKTCYLISKCLCYLKATPLSAHIVFRIYQIL